MVSLCRRHTTSEHTHDKSEDTGKNDNSPKGGRHVLEKWNRKFSSVKEANHRLDLLEPRRNPGLRRIYTGATLNAFALTLVFLCDQKQVKGA